MEKTYYWLSFRDPDENLNLGVAIVESDNIKDARDRAFKLGINPGGEILGIEMSEENVKKEGLETDKLYTRSDMIEMGYKF